MANTKPLASQSRYPGPGSLATRTVDDKLQERVSIKDFGADPSASASVNTAAIQAALNYAKTSRKSVFVPAGTYVINDTLNYTTPNELLQNDPHNGVHLFGEEGSIIKADAGWTTTKAMLNLDGNPTASESVVAYVQQHNHIQKLEFDGSGVADRAIRLRANWLGKFEDLYLYDFDGSGLGVIDIVGVTTPTKDDADTTFGCLFLRVRIRGSASGYGVLGTNNRSSSLSFINCDIRDCFSDGIRLATAGLYMYGCVIAGCGNAGQNTTGGLSIVKGQTLARNRGVAIHGCEFENNYWHEVNIDYCFGFSIIGCFGSPYQHSGALGQSWIRMGGEAAQGGFLAANSTMDYSDLYSYNIRIYDFKSGASNIEVSNPVIQRSTAVDYLVDASATQITKNGQPLSNDEKAPIFSAYMTNGSANQSMSSSTFTKLIIDTLEFDTRNNFDTTQRRFTPSKAGYYQINGGMEFSPSSGATRAMLVLYKNGSQYKRFGDVYGSSGQIEGGTVVYMNGTTDYLELYGFVTATSPAVGYGSGSTFFNGSLIRSA